MSKTAIGLIAAAAILAGVVGFVVLSSGGEDQAADTTTTTTLGAVEGQSNDQDPEPTGDQQSQSVANSRTADAIRTIAPNYDADGDGAVECMEQNTVGGFTDEERTIIWENPNASTWPPGLGEKFAAVLEECIPLEPYYLNQFSMFSWQDNACIRIMTDYVLAAYSWAEFIVKGVLDEKQRPALQAEFDTYVGNGYAAKGCFSQ